MTRDLLLRKLNSQRVVEHFFFLNFRQIQKTDNFFFFFNFGAIFFFKIVCSQLNSFIHCNKNCTNRMLHFIL